MCCVVLYCVVLCCVVLYRIVLDCILLCCLMCYACLFRAQDWILCQRVIRTIIHAFMPSGSTIQRFGKHAGCCYADILERDRDYASFLVEEHGSNPRYRDFVQFIKTTVGGIMRHGKFAGLTYHQVILKSPAYATWISDNHSNNPKYSDFALWWMRNLRSPLVQESRSESQPSSSSGCPVNLSSPRAPTTPVRRIRARSPRSRSPPKIRLQSMQHVGAGGGEIARPSVRAQDNLSALESTPLPPSTLGAVWCCNNPECGYVGPRRREVFVLANELPNVCPCGCNAVDGLISMSETKPGHSGLGPVIKLLLQDLGHVITIPTGTMRTWRTSGDIWKDPVRPSDRSCKTIRQIL